MWKGYTRHSYYRYKERCELYHEKASLAEVLKYGYTKKDFRKGSGLRKYLACKERPGIVSYVYNEQVFLVGGNSCIITVWELPNRFNSDYDWDWL